MAKNRAVSAFERLALPVALAIAWVMHDGTPASGHQKAEEAQARPELAFGRSAEFDYDPPKPGSYRLPAIKPAADGTVLNEQGRARRLANLLDGRVTILSFIYTQCNDAKGCPMASAVLAQLHALLSDDPALAATTRLISLSFDPGKDSPAIMAKYAQALRGPAGDGAEWYFLTAPSEKALQPILDGYGQRIVRAADTPEGLSQISHQLRVYLIDSSLRIRNIYNTAFLDPRLVMTDLRTILMEEAEKGH
jgi:cytochrome oxidase Cu insertion factor (SCO1/SenC/PrrC family)